MTPSDGEDFDWFGRSVSVYEGVVLVGAPRDDDHGSKSGSAYVYRYSDGVWIEETKLTAPDGGAGHRFGIDVSISGQVLLIGADDNGVAASLLGAAYVYRYNTEQWLFEATLTGSSSAGQDLFGSAVAADGDYALVAARGDNDAGQVAGAAYVFRWVGSEWLEQDKLIASDAEPSDRFGTSVALRDGRALIGARWADNATMTNTGAAYVFRLEGDTWVEEDILLASDAENNHELGRSVSLSDDLAVVGAPLVGTAYVYRNDGGSWVELAKLNGPSLGPFEAFAVSLAAEGAVTMIGAPTDDTSALNGGATYIFRIDAIDCNGNGTMDVCDISEGTSADCQFDEIPDDCQLAGNDFLPPGGDGIPDDCNCTTNDECSDDDLCNGLESCNSVTALCEPGTPVEVDDDGVDCTVDICDPATGLILHIPTDSFCDDGNLCSVDVCDAVNDCQHAPIDFTVPFGDVSPVYGVVNFDDIVCILNGFADLSTCPQGDIVSISGACPPFEPNGIDFDDILAVLQAFASTPPCAPTCR